MLDIIFSEVIILTSLGDPIDLGHRHLAGEHNVHKLTSDSSKSCLLYLGHTYVKGTEQLRRDGSVGYEDTKMGCGDDLTC